MLKLSGVGTVGRNDIGDTTSGRVIVREKNEDALPELLGPDIALPIGPNCWAVAESASANASNAKINATNLRIGSPST
jgi:hypothetical protein